MGVLGCGSVNGYFAGYEHVYLETPPPSPPLLRSEQRRKKGKKGGGGGGGGGEWWGIFADSWETCKILYKCTYYWCYCIVCMHVGIMCLSVRRNQAGNEFEPALSSCLGICMHSSALRNVHLCCVLHHRCYSRCGNRLTEACVISGEIVRYCLSVVFLSGTLGFCTFLRPMLTIHCGALSRLNQRRSHPYNVCLDNDG